MPIINVQLFPGRSRDQKSELAQRFTDAYMDVCAAPGQERSTVWVIFDEIPPDRWAVGGDLADEL